MGKKNSRFSPLEDYFDSNEAGTITSNYEFNTTNNAINGVNQITFTIRN